MKLRASLVSEILNFRDFILYLVGNNFRQLLFYAPENYFETSNKE